MKRYQVYLNPQSVNTIDESTELIGLTRSRIIREAVDAAASRIGNFLALVKPRTNNYDWLDKMIGAINIKNKKTVKLSENVDEIYYR